MPWGWVCQRNSSIWLLGMSEKLGESNRKIFGYTHLFFDIPITDSYKNDVAENNEAQRDEWEAWDHLSPVQRKIWICIIFLVLFVSNVTSCAWGDSQALPALPRAPVSHLGGTGLHEPEQCVLFKFTAQIQFYTEAIPPTPSSNLESQM